MKLSNLIFVFVLLAFHFSIAIGQIDSTLFQQKAPKKFKAKFTTTKGDFVIKAYRKWSPLGVDRFYQLLRQNYYDNNAIFRVQPDYVVQFGVSNNPEMNQYLKEHPIKDEPLKAKNKKYTISFARGGPDTRTKGIFINLNDNAKLDTINFMGVMGFPAIGKIVKGEEIVHQFFSEYGFEPTEKQDSMMVRGNAYLEENYPKLDYIIKARIVSRTSKDSRTSESGIKNN